MSTRYTFVNSKKREEAEKLGKVLTGIRDYCNAELAKAEIESPMMSDTIEDIKHLLGRALQNCNPWYKENEDDIGTFHSRGFSWAVYNGYQGLDDVREFLDTHPGFHIEDEYGTKVSLDNFISLVSGNACPISLPGEASTR